MRAAAPMKFTGCKTKMRQLVFILICLVLLAACEKSRQQPDPTETPQESTAPNANVKERLALLEVTPPSQPASQAALRLLPAQPTVTDSLTAQLSGCEGRPLYRWYLNGQLLEQQTSAHMTAGAYKKNDQIQVIGQCGATQLETNTSIINSLPQVTALQFKGPNYGTGIPLVAEAQGQDADSDELSFSFRWQIDGEELPGVTDNQLPGEQIRKGQTIVVTAIPNDGEEQGPPLVGTTFIVPNSAPSFTSQPSTGFQAQTYEYQPKAVDPDGDTLIFSLADAPAAMQIDSVTGLIRCPVAEIEGSAKVTLVVTDVDGLQAQQSFTINRN